jgi:hypothetical protein
VKNMDTKDENGIVFAGACWFMSGVVSAIFGYLDLDRVCDCPSVMIKVSDAFSAYCVCPNGAGFFATGIAACLLGIGIVLMKDKIFVMRAKMKSRSSKTEQ